MAASRRKFRGREELERVHLALCTWADDSRGGLKLGTSCAIAEGEQRTAAALSFSDQSDCIERILNHGPPEVRVFLDAYYRKERPREVICRLFGIGATTFDKRLDIYRGYVRYRLRAHGFKV